jgi:hypothetical protein
VRGAHGGSTRPTLPLRVSVSSSARWTAERRHPTGREEMSSPTLQTLQDPILLRRCLCFGGFPNPHGRSPAGWRAAERRPPPTGRQRMVWPTLQTLQDLTLGLLSRWACRILSRKTTNAHLVRPREHLRGPAVEHEVLEDGRHQQAPRHAVEGGAVPVQPLEREEAVDGREAVERDTVRETVSDTQ